MLKQTPCQTGLPRIVKEWQCPGGVAPNNLTLPAEKWTALRAEFAAGFPPSSGYTARPNRMNLAPESIGLIAGSRSLPLDFARLARAAGVKRIVCTAVEGETDPALAPLVDDIVWLNVGQLGKMISAFTTRGVKQVVMAGQVAPKNLFDLRPDLRALGVLMRLKEKNAHSIFGAIATELQKDGVELIEATPWLAPLMPQNGFALGPKISAAQKADVEFGV